MSAFNCEGLKSFMILLAFFSFSIFLSDLVHVHSAEAECDRIAIVVITSKNYSIAVTDRGILLLSFSLSP